MTEPIDLRDSNGLARCTLAVAGMDCSSCADTVEKALRRLDGVQNVMVDVVGGRVDVRYEQGRLVRGDLASAINSAGYRAQNVTGIVEASTWWHRHGRLTLAAVSGVLWVLSLIAGPLLENESAAAALAVGLAMTAMHLTRTFHPPAGIDPLLVVTHEMSWQFLLFPVASGAVLLALFALYWHKFVRRYPWPTHWW